MLQEQINSLKERIRDLDTDSGRPSNAWHREGFLLSQIEGKDRVINELMPRALPKPKMRMGERVKQLFRRPVLDT